MPVKQKPPQVANCKWVDKRWHLNDIGIHAGEHLEMELDDGWREVRIETRERGEILEAYIHIGARPFKTMLDSGDRLRWPK